MRRGTRVSWLLLWIAMSGAGLWGAEQNADQLTKAGHWKRARAVVEAALKQNPKDQHALVLMARIRRAYGQLDDAEKFGEQAVAADPKDWEAHWEVGQGCADLINTVNFMKKMGMAGNIKKEFLAAETANPNSFEVHYAMMSFYLQAPGMAGGDKQKATQEQQEVAKLNPAWGYLAELDLTPKENKDAVREALLRKAHDATTTGYDSAVPYCNLLVTQKRWEEAQKCADDLVK